MPGENGSEEIKPEETEISFLKEEVPEEGAAWMETWKDNKVDETYAAINRPIRKVADEGGESLGRRVFACNLGQWLYELDENCRLERSVKAGLESNRPVMEIMGGAATEIIT